MAKSIKNEYQTRSFTLSDIRLEKRSNGDLPIIKGLAAVFGKWSSDLGGFKEKIAPGAFKKTIAENDIRALINHNPDLLIGRNQANTLSLKESAAGLEIEITPPDTQAARDLVENLRLGNLNQMSFGFKVIKDSWADSGAERTLHEVKLYDISPVTFPAYEQTKVGVSARSISQGKAEFHKRQLEDLRLSNPVYMRLQVFKDKGYI